MLAALSDGTKQFVAIQPGYRESTASWTEVLRDLRDRGMDAPRLVVGDGALRLWAALCNVFPETDEQRCWNHRIVNVLDNRKHQCVRVVHDVNATEKVGPLWASPKRKPFIWGHKCVATGAVRNDVLVKRLLNHQCRELLGRGSPFYAT